MSDETRHSIQIQRHSITEMETSHSYIKPERARTKATEAEKKLVRIYMLEHVYIR